MTGNKHDGNMMGSSVVAAAQWVVVRWRRHDRQLRHRQWRDGYDMTGSCATGGGATAMARQAAAPWVVVQR